MDRSHWSHPAAASARQEGIVRGFDDNTFRGDEDIPKVQMVTVSANTFVQKMGYTTPRDIETLLSRYLDRDEIAQWAEGSVALATRADVLIYRTDSMFAPQSAMTRGDAAIMLHKVFMKVW